MKSVLVTILLVLISSAQGLHITVTNSDDYAGEVGITSLLVDASDAAMIDCSMSIYGCNVDIQKETKGKIYCWEEIRRIIFPPGNNQQS